MRGRADRNPGWEVDGRRDAVKRSSKVSRRTFLKAGGAGLGGVAISGAIPRFATPADGAAAPSAGGTLVFVSDNKPEVLDPGVHTSRYTAMVNQNTHDPLIWQPRANMYVPGLAERWEVAPDFKSYTFHLRSDVVFQDGTPMDAESVKFTWDRIRDPATRSTRSPQLGDYAGTDVLDKYTVRVRFAQPYPQFLQVVSSVGLAPNSPAAIKRLGQSYLKASVGTGPFKIEGWPNENTLALARNPDYRWAPAFMPNRGAAYLDRVVYRYIGEETTRTLALQKRETHVTEDPSRNLTSTFRADPHLQVLTFKTSGVPQHWPFNMTRWPSNDLAVRQACCYAVDRAKIARIAFFGTVTPAKGPLTDNNWAFWPGDRQYYAYDPAKAMAVLEAAGYRRNGGAKIYEKDGRPLRLRLVTTSTWDQVGASTMAQSMLKAVGIDLVVEAMTYDATVQRYANNEYELARLGLAYYDPDALRLAFHSSQITGGSQWNRGRLQDKALDGLLEQAAALHDVEARKQVYAKVQKMLLDMANAMFLWEDHYEFAALSCVRGWSWSVEGSYQLHNVWLDGDCRAIHS